MMSRTRILFAVALALMIGCGSEGGPDNSYRPETLVSEVECAEMIAQFETPYEVARAKVPPEFEVVDEGGETATLVFITKVCSWDNPDPLGDAETQESHFYILIAGEGGTIPVPGADVNIPVSHGYNVALDARGPSWMKDLLNHYGYQITEPPELEIEPFGEVRKGRVVEENGSGYRWTEHTLEVAPIKVGETSYFYAKNEEGVTATTEKSAVSDHDAAGFVTLEIDPESKLADFGSILAARTVDMNPMRATYTTWSK